MPHISNTTFQTNKTKNANKILKNSEIIKHVQLQPVPKAFDTATNFS